MTDTSTDQTSIQYVRPGQWQPSSARVPGIDALHSYQKEGVNDPAGPPLGNPRGGPAPADGPTAELPTIGPSAGGFNAPPQNDRKWWQRRNKSTIVLDQVANGDEWEVTQDTPQPDTMRPRDPRNTPIPLNRITQRMGPLNLAFLNRTVAARDMRHASRFNPDPGTNFAFTPSLRPSPMALGDGIGFNRFRTTQRISPAPLDQTIASEDQSNTRVESVFSMAAGLQKWW